MQLERARDEVAEARRRGFTDDDLSLLDADDARARLDATGVLGATYTPHCAAIHPARLVRGLARAVERLGVAVHEGTTVTRIDPGAVTTDRGTGARRGRRAGDRGLHGGLPGLRRRARAGLLPDARHRAAAADVWERIGLRSRETFTDHRHLVIYGQRTADGRLAFGGRGAPYHFASRVRSDYDREPATFEALRRVLVDLLPAVRDAAVTHTWGGPLGIARDWCPSVGLDRGHRPGLGRWVRR